MGLSANKSKGSSTQTAQNTSDSSSENYSNQSTNSYGSSSGSSFGSSNSESAGSSSSSNLAYGLLADKLGGQVDNTSVATNAIRSLLGLDGGGAQTTAFDNFRNSSGYNFARDEGIRGLTGSAAAKGMLGSGSALKAITGYSSDLANNFLNTYLAQLTGLSDTGLKAASAISGAGGVSSSNNYSNSSSTNGSTNSSNNYSESLGESYGKSVGTSQGTSDGSSKNGSFGFNLSK